MRHESISLRALFFVHSEVFEDSLFPNKAKERRSDRDSCLADMSGPGYGLKKMWTNNVYLFWTVSDILVGCYYIDYNLLLDGR